MNKSVDFLRKVFLDDYSGEGRSKIIHVDGAENGLDHLAIYTQNREQRENGIAMRHKVYAEEVEFPPKPQRATK